MRILTTPYIDCDLHKALMNVGYEIRRAHHYKNNQWTGDMKEYYAPSVDPNEIIPGMSRDWATEPRYVSGRGGHTYSASFVETFPYYS